VPHCVDSDGHELVVSHIVKVMAALREQKPVRLLDSMWRVRLTGMGRTLQLSEPGAKIFGKEERGGRPVGVPPRGDRLDVPGGLGENSIR
jgi:hypothetical protein